MEVLEAIYSSEQVAATDSGDIVVRIGSILLANFPELKEAVCPHFENSLFLIIGHDLTSFALLWNMSPSQTPYVLANSHSFNSTGELVYSHSFFKSSSTICSSHLGLFFSSDDQSLFVNSVTEKAVTDSSDADSIPYAIVEESLSCIKDNLLFYFIEEESVPARNESIAHQDSSVGSNEIESESSRVALLPFKLKSTFDDPIKDRKSLFVAHAAQVSNKSQVMELVQFFQKDNPKTRRATHNTFAFRLAMGDEDFDDDGEKAAGSRLLYLLQKRKASNVVVVVSRWFGGVHLGPIRFKHIQDSAIKALDSLEKFLLEENK